MATVKVVVLAGTVAAEPVERRMPSGDGRPRLQLSRSGGGQTFTSSIPEKISGKPVVVSAPVVGRRGGVGSRRQDKILVRLT